jgi:hypothetical protein
MKGLLSLPRWRQRLRRQTGDHGGRQAAIGLTAASLTTDVIVDNFVVDTNVSAVYH